MTFVVTEQCICCRYTNCVSVCPVNCFHLGENFLVINPKICIDCALCVPECPVNAIQNEYDLNNNDIKFIKINNYFTTKWPIASKKKPILPFVKNWQQISNKIKYIQK